MADIIRSQNYRNFIDSRLVGCGDSTHRCRDSGTKFLQKFILQTVGVNFVCLLLKSIIVASLQNR
jgi:hypothetical protein